MFDAIVTYKSPPPRAASSAKTSGAPLCHPAATPPGLLERTSLTLLAPSPLLSLCASGDQENQKIPSCPVCSFSF